MGIGRSGGRSLVGRLDGSSRSKSESIIGSSGGLSSGVYCGGGPEKKKGNQSVNHERRPFFHIFLHAFIVYSKIVILRLRHRLHEHGFTSTRFHDLETASKSMRFGSVYADPFSPENPSRNGISESCTTC